MNLKNISFLVLLSILFVVSSYAVGYYNGVRYSENYNEYTDRLKGFQKEMSNCVEETQNNRLRDSYLKKVSDLRTRTDVVSRLILADDLRIDTKTLISDQIIDFNKSLKLVEEFSEELMEEDDKQLLDTSREISFKLKLWYEKI